MKSALYLISISLMLGMAACSSTRDNSSDQTNLNKDSIANALSLSKADSAALNSPGTTGFDHTRLVGDWERTDGDYTLRIYSASSDGKLDATYFNPASIHVARAEWSLMNDYYMVMIEFQDVNYPGSTYTLEYNPEGDQLNGNYYQAVEKINYEVGFTRKN
jgi:hypothetical protein